MSEAVVPLLVIAVVVFATGFAWLLYATWQVDWRWTLASLAGLPLLLFCVRHWRRARGPLAVVALSPLLAIVVLAAAGDLVRDRHPDEPVRTFGQRLYGCSGSALWTQLLASDHRPLQDFLGPFPMASAPLSSELAIGRAAAHVAALAYLEPDAVREQTLRWNLPADRVATRTAGSQFAVVLARDDVLFVAFRGTDDVEDWLKNVEFIPAPTPWGTVHKGFLDALDSLWPSVSASIEHLRTRGQPIWLVGHSLGGALAVLAAARLQQRDTRVAGVVTFGQPPAGYGTFAETFARDFKAPLLRYANHVDAVVGVAFFTLTHVGDLRYFDTAGRLHRGKPALLQQFRDVVCAPAFEPGAELHSHYVRRYVALLDRAAAR